MLCIDFHYETFLIVFLIIAVMICTFLKLKKKSFYDYLYALTVLMYVMLLIKVVFLPIRVVYDQENYNMFLRNALHSLQLVPFKTISQMFVNGEWKMQVLGNILLLLPIPILLKYRKKEPKYSDGRLFAVGLIISLGIELVQFGINELTGVIEKVVDIDDIILNSIGVLIGVIISKYSMKITNKLKGERNEN